MHFEIRVKVSFVWLWVLTVLCICVCVVRSACPGVCVCPPVSQNVYCSRKNLPYIPNGIPSNTVQLNLNDNSFQNPVLMIGNFSRYTLLEHLYLSGCGVEFISKDTFADLSRLKWLDLSKNRLKTIADYTFRGLVLEHLFLNDNPGVHINKGAFNGLRTMGMYIHNCAIANISIEVVRPLNGTLKSLWLDGNKFDSFHTDWLYMFRSLSHLRLGDNPFHCNCEVEWLFNFFQLNPSVFSGGDPPECRSPARHRGSEFNTMTVDDFRCQLPIFKNVDIIFESVLGKLTCMAAGDPTPVLYWIKPDGSSEKFAPKLDDGRSDNEGVMYISDPQLIENAKYRCIASNPAGNVTLSLNVVWPPLQIAGDSAVIEDNRDIPTKHPPKDMKPMIKDQNTHDTDKTRYNWNTSKTGVMAEQKVRNNEIHFTMVDIIGAVVGTFLLTLLACVAVFHIFYRRHEKLIKETNKKNTQLKPPNCYVMSEGDHENRIRMLQHTNIDGLG